MMIEKFKNEHDIYFKDLNINITDSSVEEYTEELIIELEKVLSFFKGMYLGGANNNNVNKYTVLNAVINYIKKQKQ